MEGGEERDGWMDLRVTLDVVAMTLHHGLGLQVLDDSADVVIVDDLDAFIEVDWSFHFIRHSCSL